MQTYILVNFGTRFFRERERESMRENVYFKMVDLDRACFCFDTSARVNFT